MLKRLEKYEKEKDNDFWNNIKISIVPDEKNCAKDFKLELGQRQPATLTIKNGITTKGKVWNIEVLGKEEHKSSFSWFGVSTKYTIWIGPKYIFQSYEGQEHMVYLKITDDLKTRSYFEYRNEKTGDHFKFIGNIEKGAFHTSSALVQEANKGEEKNWENLYVWDPEDKIGGLYKVDERITDAQPFQEKIPQEKTGKTTQKQNIEDKDGYNKVINTEKGDDQIAVEIAEPAIKYEWKVIKSGIWRDGKIDTGKDYFIKERGVYKMWKNGKPEDGYCEIQPEEMPKIEIPKFERTDGKTVKVYFKEDYDAILAKDEFDLTIGFDD